jgi:uncharacterized NAD(P)/FAD-binding protein YdhS
MAEDIPRPTLKQEYEELGAIRRLLQEYEDKALEYHRLANSLKIMKHTIEQSIEQREKESEAHPTLTGSHHKEMEEIKNAKKSN